MQYSAQKRVVSYMFGYDDGEELFVIHIQEAHVSFFMATEFLLIISSLADFTTDFPKVYQDCIQMHDM